MTQTAWTTVADRVVTKMQEITNIGLVHNRERFVTDLPTWKSISTTVVGGKEVARMWMVHLQGMDANLTTSGYDTHWNRRVVVRGYLEIDDANSSELSSVALIEAVVRKLTAEARNRLGNLVHDAKPPVLTVNEPRTFGFVICHYVEVQMEVVTIESLT